MNPPPLEPGLYREVVRRALAEDLGWGDETTRLAVPAAARATGVLVAGADIVLAGLEIGLEAFRQLDPALAVERHRSDGDECSAREPIATLRGLAAPMLTAERTALNFLRHLSGVATATRRHVEAGGGTLRIADTRRTLPLLRTLQKYAVRVGGGVNTRQSLDDGILIEGNHASVGGGPAACIERVRSARPDAPIQIEVANLEQAEEALKAGAAVIAYTGTSPAELRQIVRQCAGRARAVVGGLVPVERLAAFASAGADAVSVGSLTESAQAADITLELRHE